MSRSIHRHATLLAMQLASIFKYIADEGYHRSTYKTFESLEDDIITYDYIEDNVRKGRSSADVKVSTEHNTFIFKQWFNFGILLELELLYRNPDGTFCSLMTNFLEGSDKDSDVSGRMIDFEYAISILTEHVATQLNNI